MLDSTTNWDNEHSLGLDSIEKVSFEYMLGLEKVHVKRTLMILYKRTFHII